MPYKANEARRDEIPRAGNQVGSGRGPRSRPPGDRAAGPAREVPSRAVFPTLGPGGRAFRGVAQEDGPVPRAGVLESRRDPHGQPGATEPATLGLSAAIPAPSRFPPAEAAAGPAARPNAGPRCVGFRPAHALPCAPRGEALRGAASREEGNAVAQSSGDVLDCLVVGGGPAGLTAALYLARFKRRFLVVDEGAPRAAWIPESHNIPFFAEGIPGPEILARQRGHAGRYGVDAVASSGAPLRRLPWRHFEAAVEEKG